MHVVIRHHVLDPTRWDRSSRNILSLAEQHRLPAGLRPLAYLPSVDGRKADGVWEADSMLDLRRFVDRETIGAARNEYFAVNAEAAIGLPRGEELVEANGG
jgi:hypothetical protein